MKMFVKSVLVFVLFGGMAHVLFVSHQSLIPQHLKEWVAVSLVVLLFFTVVWIRDSENRSDGD
jgi:hypothetical protein